MAQLWRIIEVLGPSVVRLISSADGAHAELADVSLYDPGEPLGAARGDLVLAVGAVSAVDVHAIIRACAHSEAAALACKPPASDDPSVCAAADAAGVALLRVEPAVRWGQLHVLARDAVASAGDPIHEQASSIRLGDLFAVADAVAARVGGAVTIEDGRSRVLAYSNTPAHELDEPRRQTILGRGVPDRWLQHHENTGIFAQLWTTDDVVEVPADPDVGLRRRLAVRVRAGKQVLGSVWVLEGSQQLGDDARERLADAARFVALHLLAHRSKADVERDIVSGLLRRLLEGGGSAGQFAERLGIRADDPCTVVAFRPDTAEGQDHPAGRDSVVNLIALHSEAFRWQAASLWIEDTVYVLLPTSAPAQRVVALAQELVDRMVTLLGVSVTAGVGSQVSRLQDAVVSRREADQVLRALVLRGGSVATASEVAAQRVLLALADLVKERPELGSDKVRDLIASDAQQGTVYVETLRAYLDAFGNAQKAGEELNVHPNTVRYRVQRALALAQLDLGDGDERVVVELGLRLLAGEYSTERPAASRRSYGRVQADPEV